MYGALQGYATTLSPCESYGHSWWLFWEAASGLLMEGLALALLWWHLQRHPVKETGCQSSEHVWFCQSSEAHVLGFPLLGAGVCVAVAQRQLFRKRIYYGLLKRGIVIDFRAVERRMEPLLICLVWCLLCAILHEIAFYTPRIKVDDDDFKIGLKDVLKVKVGSDDARRRGHLLSIDYDDEASTFLLSYCAPCLVFLVFLYGAHQIETSLLPFNTYYVDDPEEAKRMLSRASVIDELQVASAAEIMLVSGQDPPSDVDIAYENLANMCRAQGAPSPLTNPWGIFRHYAHGLLSVPWPAPVLLEPSYSDADSSSFRRMLMVFSATCAMFLIVVCAELSIHAWFLWQAALGRGNDGLVTPAVILSLHLLVVIKILHTVCMCCPRCCSCS
mmetsp:Transcript_70900/g.140651  ORF Transcript_70900/g.140651 Transcript_70900/m.140651 type:complete len:387 (-) Transcript_70900:7-1167(-)